MIAAHFISVYLFECICNSRSLDFLTKALEKFPDKDYCIITLPPNVPDFALIQNFIVRRR